MDHSENIRVLQVYTRTYMLGAVAVSNMFPILMRFKTATCTPNSLPEFHCTELQNRNTTCTQHTQTESKAHAYTTECS